MYLTNAKINKGERDHNVESKDKCDKCHKVLGFYWCTGHSYVFGAGRKRGYKSKLDPKLRDVDDQPI